MFETLQVREGVHREHVCNFVCMIYARRAYAGESKTTLTTFGAVVIIRETDVLLLRM